MRRTLLTILTLLALSPLAGHAASVTVKSGETLSDIAARYGVSVNSLMRVNGLRVLVSCADPSSTTITSNCEYV